MGWRSKLALNICKKLSLGLCSGIETVQGQGSLLSYSAKDSIHPSVSTRYLVGTQLTYIE